MIIDPLSASKFIAVYKALLLEIDRTPHDGRKFNLVKRLAAARSRLLSDPSLIDQALVVWRALFCTGAGYVLGVSLDLNFPLHPKAWREDCLDLSQTGQG